MIENELQKASQLLQQGQFGPAAQVLAQCLESDPDSVRSLALMADAQAGLHGPEKALDYLGGITGQSAREPELLAKMALYQAGAGQLPKAALTYQQYLERLPEDAARWLDYSQVLATLRRYQEAAQACAKAIEHAPRNPDGYLKLGELLQRFGSYPQAISVYQQGLLQISDDARLQGDLAAAFKSCGEVQKAEEAFAVALTLDPDNAITHYNLATLKLETGQFDEARLRLRDAVRLEPRFAHAYQQLVYLEESDGAESDETLARMESLAQDANMPDDGQARILFGLAHLYDKRGDYRSAMRTCKRANGLRAQQKPFDAQQYRKVLKRHTRVFSTALLKRFPPAASERPRPVVIAGMPRTGTTLIDQMLCGHPAIASLGENDFMTRVKGESVRRFQNQFGYPDSIQNCSPIDLMALRNLWYEQARKAAPGAAFVVDKTLTNYLNIGLFKLLFPDCVVIEATRDWNDVALSMYFADFAEGHEYAFSREGLKHFRDGHEELMAHWRAQEMSPWVQVAYERLVAHPHETLAPVFEQLSLTPHADLETFHRRNNQVRTLSQTQVRRPLNTESVGKYQRYQPYWD